MTMVRKLICAWMLALVGGFLLPMVSVAAVSGTTYSHVPTTTTIRATIAEHADVARTDWSSSGGLQSMASNQSWAPLSLSHSFVAPKNGTEKRFWLRRQG
jgi:hypothetical protein